MRRLLQKTRGITRSQRGFTLVELLVVLGILALLVGLVVPNFFAVTGEMEAIQMQAQHERLRVAVLLYHMDTAEWPTEWSGYDLNAPGADQHELWEDDAGGWDGPYIDRPILQNNRWGGDWGVREDRILNLVIVDNTGGDQYTTLLFENVPLEVAEALDAAMDDGAPHTGAVQYGGTTWPSGDPHGGGPPGDSNFLEIIIARQ